MKEIRISSKSLFKDLFAGKVSEKYVSAWTKVSAESCEAISSAIVSIRVIDSKTLFRKDETPCQSLAIKVACSKAGNLVEASEYSYEKTLWVPLWTTGLADKAEIDYKRVMLTKYVNNETGKTRVWATVK